MLLARNTERGLRRSQKSLEADRVIAAETGSVGPIFDPCQRRLHETKFGVSAVENPDGEIPLFRKLYLVHNVRCFLYRNAMATSHTNRDFLKPVLEHCFEMCDLSCVHCRILPPNQQSRSPCGPNDFAFNYGETRQMSRSGSSPSWGTVPEIGIM